MSPSVRLKTAVSTLRNLLLCSLCSELLSDTHTVTECGHLFCSTCAYQHVGTRMNCPTCGLPARVGKLVKNPKYDVLVACVKRLMRNMLAPETAENADATAGQRFPLASTGEEPPSASLATKTSIKLTENRIKQIDVHEDATDSQRFPLAPPSEESPSASPTGTETSNELKGAHVEQIDIRADPADDQSFPLVSPGEVSPSASPAGIKMSNKLTETRLTRDQSETHSVQGASHTTRMPLDLPHELSLPNVSDYLLSIANASEQTCGQRSRSASPTPALKALLSGSAPPKVLNQLSVLEGERDASPNAVQIASPIHKRNRWSNAQPGGSNKTQVEPNDTHLESSPLKRRRAVSSMISNQHAENEVVSPNQDSPTSGMIDELTRLCVDAESHSKMSVRQNQRKRKPAAKAIDPQMPKSRRKSEGPNMRRGFTNTECEEDAVTQTRKTRRSTISTIPSDISKHQYQAVGGGEPEKFVEVLLTGVSGEHMKLIESAAATGSTFESSKSSLQFSISPAKTFDEHITHVVAGVVSDSESEKGSNICGRTLKYMYGVAKGIWVVRSEWLLDSLSAGKWMAEEEYEIQGDAISGRSEGPKKARERRHSKLPPLFEQCRFYFHGEFGWPNVSLQDLGHLVLLGGGTVLHRRPTAKIYATSNKPCDTYTRPGVSPPAKLTSIPQPSEQESSTKDNSTGPIEEMRLDLSLPLVVFDPGRTEANEAAWMRKYQMVSSIWLLDCISAGRVLVEKR